MAATVLTGLSLSAATLIAQSPLDVTAAAEGVRLGPLETMCVPLPDATPGDIALTNTTVVASSNFGFVTTHNRNVDPRSVSSVNFDRDSTRPNLTATLITDQQDICVTPNATTSAHVVLDLVGYIAGAAFHPVDGDTQRILDTRLAGAPTSGQPVAAGATVCAAATAHAPGDVAIANVTITEPSAHGFTTVHAEGALQPVSTSTHNFAPGESVANLTFTPLGTGPLCATNSKWASTHVIFDLVGFIDSSQFTPAGDEAIRLVDTRLDPGPTQGNRLASSQTLCVDVAAAVAGATAVANVTITEPQASGYATVHHESADPTASSTHNFTADQSVGNLTATELTDAGQLCVTPSKWSPVHAIIDLGGTISPGAFTAAPNGAQRIVDTRTESAILGRNGISRLTDGASCDALLEQFISQRLAWLDQFEVVDDTIVPPIFLPATNGNRPVSTPAFSTTNTQDERVDEGDIVETDGRYLYTTVDQELRVIDIAAARVEARVRLDGAHAEMILHDGRLMVTTRGFDKDYQFSHTNVAIIDVSRPSEPFVVDRYGLDGTRVAMRSVADRVHIVLASDLSPDGTEYAWGSGTTVTELRQKVRESTIDDWLPQVYTIEPGATYGSPQAAIDCADIAQPHVASGSEMTWVASDSLSGGSGPDGTTGIMADADVTDVMATPTSLYIATRSYPSWGFGGWNTGETMTSVHQFEIPTAGAVRYLASGDVPGRLVNQFAMGEHNGVLRVAVTDGWWESSASAVFALRRVGSTFERLSAITDLGPSESIYAVRHMGSLSYVVTFRQIDPLYVLDFGDPVHPALLGELKIPGFSTYLHPVGPGLLLGVGMDADEGGRVEGAQLSLFDISNPSDPQRISTLDIDSSAWFQFSDHRAFLFWAPTGTIAIPSFNDAGDAAIAVSRLDGRTLRTVGKLAPTVGGQCLPLRTIAVGDELIAVSDYTVVIADAQSLRPRAELGTCLPGWIVESIT